MLGRSLFCERRGNVQAIEIELLEVDGRLAAGGDSTPLDFLDVAPRLGAGELEPGKARGLGRVRGIALADIEREKDSESVFSIAPFHGLHRLEGPARLFMSSTLATRPERYKRDTGFYVVSRDARIAGMKRRRQATKARKPRPRAKARVKIVPLTERSGSRKGRKPQDATTTRELLVRQVMEREDLTQEMVADELGTTQEVFFRSLRSATPTRKTLDRCRRFLARHGTVIDNEALAR
jgi:hypothetical protein